MIWRCEGLDLFLHQAFFIPMSDLGEGMMWSPEPLSGNLGGFLNDDPRTDNLINF